MDENVALLRNRFRSTTVQASVSTDDDKCLLLDLPEEVRCIIYEYLVPDRFLPAAPRADYYGLFYSCQQIRHEMTRESLRKTQGILRRAKQATLEKLLNHSTLPPAAPQRALTLLMNNIVISLTGTLIFNHLSHVSWLAFYEPLFTLHLNSLTLRLSKEDYIVSTDGVDTMWWRTSFKYRDVVPFATRINCVVAGSLCLNVHHRKHKRCIRRLPAQPGEQARVLRLIPNVRVITLHFERLSQHTGFATKMTGPSRDRKALGHYCGWTYSEKTVRRMGGYNEKEVKIVWTTLDIHKKDSQMWSRWKKPDGKLLRGVGEPQKEKKVKWYRRVHKKKAGKPRKQALYLCVAISVEQKCDIFAVLRHVCSPAVQDRA